MLRLYSTLENIPVLSLRTGGVIATTNKIILNPDNLKIEGWHTSDRFSKTNLILVASDVREIIEKGIAVNDHEVLTPQEDLVRLKPVLEIGFELNGKTVETEAGKKIGKVVDFAIETKGLMVSKLYVGQSLIKNFAGGVLSIDRSHIVEITSKRIIIDEPAEKAKVQSVMPAPAS